jgi:hypothetical protein
LGYWGTGGTRETRGTGGTRETRVTRETRGTRGTRETRETRETRGTRETREIENRWRILIALVRFELNALPSTSRRGVGGEVAFWELGNQIN